MADNRQHSNAPDLTAAVQLGRGFTLLVGGARSGKSDLAVALGRAFDGDVAVAATAVAGDDDMAQRIQRHQHDRPTDWGLIEEPLLDASMIEGVDPTAMLIIDCVTLLVTNLMLADKSDEQIDRHASVLAHALVSRRAPTIVISNEVGLGVVPNNELGRRFRDLLGRYNNRLSSRAETALFVAAGRVMPLRPLNLTIAS